MALYDFTTLTDVHTVILIREIAQALGISILSFRTQKVGSGRKFWIETTDALSDGQKSTIAATIASHSPPYTDSQRNTVRSDAIAARKVNLAASYSALVNDWDATPSNYSDVQANLSLLRNFIILYLKNVNL